MDKCVMCGAPAMPNRQYCYQCWKKWGKYWR